jgi:hypothetical protein
MSIVVSMLVPKSGFFIYADKRVVVSAHTWVDTFVKVHAINKELAAGITGHAGWGLPLINRLKNSPDQTPSKLIQMIVTAGYDMEYYKINSTITLGGLYDNGKPFLFMYASTGKQLLKRSGIISKVATDPLSLKDQCSTYLAEQLQKTGRIDLSIINTIAYASELRPNLISSDYDKVEIFYRP